MKVKFFEEYFGVSFNLDIEEFSEISTDTRNLKKGALFIALKGKNFDGNKFAKEAFSKGAVVALVSDKSIKGRVVVVKDSLKSFQKLSKAWQDQVAPLVVGITGSNGKTTSKFFTAQILESFFKIRYSPKSFNNRLGVPITQSLLKEGDHILIAEIGTSAQGEILELMNLVQPHIGVVTTVGPAHLKGFGSVDNVALEKSNIYKYSKIKKGIFNLDNKWTKEMFKNFNGEKISFSTLDPRANIYLKADQKEIDELTLSGQIFGEQVEFKCNIFGKHNAYNLMIALAVGVTLGIKTKKLVEKVPSIKTPWGRSQVLKNSYGGKVLFDGYNSNLQSMEVLFDSMKDIIRLGKSVHFILGEMLELGEAAYEMHRELGRKAGGLKPTSILFIGPSFKQFEEGVKDSGFNNNLIISSTYNDSLAINIKTMLDPKETVVVKGSRGMKLERFFNFLGL